MEVSEDRVQWRILMSDVLNIQVILQTVVG